MAESRGRRPPPGGRGGGGLNRRNLPLVALLILAACALAPAARAALLAIDFGSENLKMCLVKPGRTPISIVVNEFSRRKSPSLVGVIAGDRVVGEEGSTMAVKRPQEVFLRTRDLLGRRADDPYLKEMLDAHLLPYEVAAHPRRAGAAALVAPPGSLAKDGEQQQQQQLLFPPEELVASVLQYAREAAELYSNGGKPLAAGAGAAGAGGSGGAAAGGASKAPAPAPGSVVDTVIAVPAWWGLEQRRALADAAGLAGLNLLALINSHSAAALQYGIERDFSGGGGGGNGGGGKSKGGDKGGDKGGEGEQLVLLFDVGAGSTEAALVRFSAYQEGGRASGKSVNQFEVVDVEWDPSAGANELDAALMRHLAAEFDAKHPPASSDSSSEGESAGGVLSSPKAVAKLRKQVRRTKEILSANAVAPFSAEELHDGADFSTTVSREQLEALAAPWFARAASVAERLLARQKVPPQALSAVELLGGGSRVPGLQAALSKALGGRALDRHLDADEAVALGAGLFAANLSSTFRLRKFGMADAAPYGVEFESLDLELPAAGAAAAASPSSAAADKPSASAGADGGADDGSSDAEAPASSSSPGASVVRALLPPGKRLPARRAVKFHGLTADAFSFSLKYNASSPRGLPPGVPAPGLLARYRVSGISKAVKRYGGSGATVLRFEADHGGRVELAEAECVVSRDEPEEREVLDEEAYGAAVAAATAEASARAAVDQVKVDEEHKKATEEAAAAAAAAAAAKEEAEAAAAKDGKNGTEAAGKKKAPPPPPATTPRNLTAEYVSAAISALARPMKNVTFTRTRTYRVALDVAAIDDDEEGAAGGNKGKAAASAAASSASGMPLAAWAQPPLLGEALDEARATVAGWTARELKKRESAKARNDLEAHVISTREALGEEGGGEGEGEGEDGSGGSGSGSGGGGDDGDFASSASPLRRASTPTERAALREALMDAEDWLYSDEGNVAEADALRARLASLRALGGRAEARAKELVARPARLREARAYLADARAELGEWAEARPWITAAEAKKAAAALDGLDKWLAAREAAQAKKQESEEGAFSAADVEAKVSEARLAFRAVGDKPKPAEPKKKDNKKDDKKGGPAEEAEAGKKDEAAAAAAAAAAAEEEAAAAAAAAAGADGKEPPEQQQQQQHEEL